MLQNSDRLDQQRELPALNLSPRKVTKFLLSIIALLVFFNLVERAIVYGLNLNSDSEILSKYFNFDQEANFPSLYSALALGFSSYLLIIIATLKRADRSRFAQKWKTLSYIFLFLAIDEACSIHELFIPII